MDFKDSDECFINQTIIDSDLKQKKQSAEITQKNAQTSVHK